MAKHTMCKSLSCDLTTEEINTYSQELASITTEQSEIEGEKKEIMSTFTARLNKCIADGRVLARKITTRKEDRQVECDLNFDYAKGMVYTIRTDTGVTIGQRKLTDDERQQWLDLDAEEGRRQEAEDKRNEAPEENVIEGELLQIEHRPEDPPAAVCYNKNCKEYDPSEPNGCGGYEYVEECLNADVTPPEKLESDECARCHEATQCQKCCDTCESQCNLSQICLVKEAEAEELAEFARRDTICDEWRFCEHKDICFLPENESEGICFKSDSNSRLPDQTPLGTLTFQELMGWGYKRNEAKIIAAGFQLVKFDREEKQLSVTAVDPRGGWLQLPARETWAAAERDLETMITDGMINVVGNNKAGVSGNKCISALRNKGFEFYRKEDSRIKYGSGWRTWKKFNTPEECTTAWDTLMTTHPYVLED